MVSVAPNKASLLKRVARFFASEDRAELRAFLDSFSDVTDIFIFGGAVRDIARSGVNNFRSDIDIVYEGNSKEVSKFLKKLKPNVNKFGGYRLLVGEWPIDVWEAETSWAFKQGHKEYTGIDSLLETTITNWDSVIYDWNNKKLISTQQYLENLLGGYLDIQLIENANELGMFVRLLKLHANEEVKVLSPKAASLLCHLFKNYSFESVKNYEYKSYGMSNVTVEMFMELKNDIASGEIDLLPIDLVADRQKDLFS